MNVLTNVKTAASTAALAAMMAASVGCYQSVDLTELLKAEQFCAGRGGVRTILESFAGVTRIYCINGEMSKEIDIKLESTE